MDGPLNYDDVVHDLIAQMLGELHKRDATDQLDFKKLKIKRDKEESAAEREQRETIEAQDAARKLVSLPGKRSVPALAQLFRATWDKPDTVAGAVKASYYSGWALSRIRHADAARALLPALLSNTARSELRHFAVDALGNEKSPECVKALQKVAITDTDIEIRKKALGQLMVIPEYWTESEPIFLKSLSDLDPDIRTLAAKACHFSHTFTSCNEKLVELLESDPVSGVRMLAMLTLGRARYKLAQPALVRVLENPATEEKLRKVALSSFCQITEIAFSKPDNALAWWKKEGELKFTETERREKEKEEALKQLEETEKRERKDALKKINTEAASAPAPLPIPGMNSLNAPQVPFQFAPSNSNGPAPLMLARPNAEPERPAAPKPAPPAPAPIAKPKVELLPDVPEIKEEKKPTAPEPAKVTTPAPRKPDSPRLPGETERMYQRRLAQERGE